MRPLPTLIAYDIRNRQRLVRVHRLLCRHALPLQKSLFCAEWTAQQRAQAMASLRRLCDAEDDLRMYVLPERPKLWLAGARPLLPGIQLVGDGWLPQFCGSKTIRDASRPTR